MIFILELYLRERKAKLREWERRGQAWLEEKNESSRYARYDFDDWKKIYPPPVLQFKKMAYTLLPVLVGLTVFSLIAWAFIAEANKPVDPNNPHDCSVAVKKGDKVAVSAGRFDGSEGTVIEQKSDCSVNLRLTNSTYSFSICTKTHDKSYCDDTKENGTILNVDRSSNIIKL